jgi:hypothetical protein
MIEFKEKIPTKIIVVPPNMIYTSTFQRDGFKEPTHDVKFFALRGQKDSNNGPHKIFGWWECEPKSISHSYYRVSEGSYRQFYYEITRDIMVPGRIHTHYNINRKSGVVFSIHFIPDGTFISGTGTLDDIDDFCNRLIALDVMET